MSQTSTTSDNIPIPTFETLFSKLAHVLEVASSSTTQNQALFQATTAFKENLAAARKYAENLPGGDLLVEEQNVVIALLEKLRDWKQAQFEYFSSRSTSTADIMSSTAQVQMEIDSTASSPHD